MLHLVSYCLTVNCIKENVSMGKGKLESILDVAIMSPVSGSSM